MRQTSPSNGTLLQETPIAIVGISAIMPDAVDVDDFWRNVLEGRDHMVQIPPDRWQWEDYFDPDPDAPDKTYCRRGAFLPEVEFDPIAFGMPPRMLPATDSAQLLALIAADALLRDVGTSAADGERVGVFLGSLALKLVGEMAIRMAQPTLRRAMRENGVTEALADTICERAVAETPRWQEATFPGLLSNVVAGRIANKFDLHGANFTVDAACASSLAALSVAIDDLVLRRSDLAITGGVDTLNDPLAFTCFSKTPALSATGDCRPFSDAADGTMLGEGLAMFALKRLSDAERDGDGVYAVIRGVGASSDGAGTSVYAPLEAGQVRAMRRAYEAAGYGPDSVGLVEAHGTGTSVGDPVEVSALRAVFEESGRTQKQWCALGSVKSQIGHTKGAAGAAGLLKAALALHHKVLPPTINVERPNPELDLESSPFYLNTSARPWLHDAEHPRRAAVSSFGFGGSNFHVTLEEHVTGRAARRCLARPTELVTLSATSLEELLSRCRELAEERDHAVRLPVIAHRTQEAVDAAHGFRLAIVASGVDDLVAKLDQAANLIAKQPETGFSAPTGIHYRAGAGIPGRIAFVFPGQGSQHVGMGADIAMHFAQAQAVWDRTAGADLGEVVFPRPVFSDEQRLRQKEILTRTEWAQPAIAAHSVALLELLAAVGVRPDCVAGHSFGELVALHAARAFDADTLMRIACRRGELIRDASAKPGAMLAVDASREDVTALIERNGVVDAWIANHNTPRQVVVSGCAESLASLQELLAEQGTESRRLETGAAFHSPLVASASEPLREFLSSQTVRAPLLDVYGNTAAAVYCAEPEHVRRCVAEHLASPVRFADMIGAMHADGVRVFVEVGPGSVLSGLIGHILDGAPHDAIAVDRVGRHGVTSFNDALGRLTALGVPLAYDVLWDAHARPEVEQSSRPQMRIAITGSNLHERPSHAQAAERPARPAGLAEQPPPHTALPPGLEDQIAMPAPNVNGMVSTMPAAATGAQDDVMRALIDAQHEAAQAHAAYLTMVTKSIDAITSVAGMPTPTDEDGWAPPGFASGPGERAGAAPVAPATVAVDPAHAALATQSTVAAVVAPGTDLVLTIDDATDLEAVVMSVVSDKTGYPVEMLAPHLELERDLGLDSITRTQILAALRAMFPGMVSLDRSQLLELMKLTTVGAIADKIRELAGRPELLAAPPAIAATAESLCRQALGTIETLASGEPMEGLADGVLVVTEDGGGVAGEVVRQLGARGVTATTCTVVPDDAHGVVFLGGLAEVSSVEQALAVQHDAFHAARVLAPHMQDAGGVFVTVQDTGADFGLTATDPVRSWLGGLAALARTAGQEWPKAAVKAIDCARGARSATEIAAAVVDELLEGGRTLDVGLAADGTRRTLHVLESPAASGTLQLGEQPVIVATGGATGVTAAALRALAQRAGARFVLVGRTPLEPGAANADPRAQEIGATIAALEEAGSEARYVAADIRDRERLRTALAAIREEWGPIAGIVHGAGVLADGAIADKTDEQFDEVFGTKVEGLRVLLEETAHDPLRLLCAFSSVVGSFGNAGQCDYAMANETLNHVLAAEHAKRPECVVRALVWGPWHGGMVTPALEEIFRMVGVGMLSMEIGARAFVAELESDSTDPRVILTAGHARSLLGEVSLVAGAG